MINIKVFSEEKAWSKRLKSKNLFFKKICKAFPSKYRFLNKKCLTLREETERPITVLKGTNKVIGVNKNITNEINEALNTKLTSHEEIELWDGNTSERIFEDFIGK